MGLRVSPCSSTPAEPQRGATDQAQHRARQPLVDDGAVVVVAQVGPEDRVQHLPDRDVAHAEGQARHAGHDEDADQPQQRRGEPGPAGGCGLSVAGVGGVGDHGVPLG